MEIEEYVTKEKSVGKVDFKSVKSKIVLLKKKNPSPNA